MTRFFLTDAPGHYGDWARVYGSYATLAAAVRARAGGGIAIRCGDLEVGERMHSQDEAAYPLARVALNWVRLGEVGP